MRLEYQFRPRKIVNSFNSVVRILIGIMVLSGWISGIAETIRVTTWNLDEQTATVQDAAAALGRLDPDVIVLQPVRNWQACSTLAQALKPAEYNILVCSAFRDGSSGPLSPVQTAILSKRKAYFTWTAAWRAQGETSNPGGFAFAAVQIGKRRIGIFSLALDPSISQSAPPNSSTFAPIVRQQWLDEVATFRNWTTNRLDSVVAAGFQNSSQNLATGIKEDSRGISAFLAIPLDEPVNVPPAAIAGGTTPIVALPLPASRQGSLSGVVIARRAVTIELDLNPAPVPAPVLTQAIPATEALQPAPRHPHDASQAGPRLILWASFSAGILVLATAVAWIFRRRSAKRLPTGTPILIAENASGSSDLAGSYTLVINAPPSDRQGVTQSLPQTQLVATSREPENTSGLLESWQRRALAAEHRAAQAQEALRAGAMGHLKHWLKQHLVKGLITDRARLLETQHAAALKAMAVDERLEKIELQLQQQNRAYLERIEKLTSELVAAKEENRELILAQISRVKSEMETARIRLLTQARARDS
jgi:hypothetical protein